jgi:hypothetical protein
LGQDTEEKEEIRGERKVESKERIKGVGGIRDEVRSERELGYTLGSEVKLINTHSHKRTGIIINTFFTGEKSF